MSKEHLIIGLGNPGAEYEYTRHNLGFLVIRHLAEQLKLKFENSSLTRGLTAEKEVDGVQVHFLLPMTYMNNSGAAVKQFLMAHPVDDNNILVVTDDFNLDFGQLRIRKSGSDGGHNGLKSIIEQLNTEGFGRLRMGIGRPGGKKDTVDYVLEEFKKTEKEKLGHFIEQAGDCCLAWIQQGIDKTMNQFNQRRDG